MTIDQLIAKQEIRELVDEFSILADNRDAKGQGPLFTEDAVLEFQLGPEGEVHEIPGRDAIVAGAREPAQMPHAEILAMMELMDGLRRAWGVRFPMDESD